jgi:HD-like signal output (HDOD) protein
MTDDEPTTNSGAARSTEEALEASLREIGIPPRPAILDRIDAEMRKPDPDLRYLSDLISADVGLAAGLLKTVNSPYFGFQSRARTVMQALMMLGLAVASRAVAGLVMRRVFPPLPALERFWDGSARVARASGWLVGRLGVRENVRADDAYTYGLFRDCGIPILMKKFPGYVGVLQRANADTERPFTLIEREFCPTDHALVGCLMAQHWLLPDEIGTAIRHHHDAVTLASGATSLPAASVRLAALSQLAEYLVQRVSKLSKTREWDKMSGVCQGILGLDGIGVEALVAEAPPVVADLIA